MKIECEIRDSFPEYPIASIEKAVGESRTIKGSEAEQIAEFLDGASWHDITWSRLGEYGGDLSAILHFLEPIGFVYYLPSFLLIALNYTEESDVLPDSLIYVLAPSNYQKNGLLKRWKLICDLLSGEQKEAVLGFLDSLVNQNIDEYGESARSVAYELERIGWKRGD